MRECCAGRPQGTGEIVRYFDRRVKRYEKRHEKGLGAASRAIVESLSSQGVAGRSLLEIGPGLGYLTFELIERGISQARGIDLSPEMVTTAREHASQAGYSAKAAFDVGDGAEERLPQADIVVLDKVMCCYPTLEPLLSNSISACNSLYGFSVPSDKGPWRFLLRLAFSLERVSLRIRGCRACTYIHSTDQMNSALVRRGFRLVFEKGVGSWLVRVYRNDGSLTR